MTDRPILFSAPMIRALLAGTKTQTRRKLKPQPPEWATFCQQPSTLNIFHQWVPSGLWAWSEEEQTPPRPLRRWPIDASGQHYWLRPKFASGDRLWVRETWQGLSFGDYQPTKSSQCEVRYAATDPCADLDAEARGYPWRPSIFMPRWASRLTLSVTDVRVERLQDISEADAVAEGIERHKSGWMPYSTAFYDGDGITPANYHADPRISYMQLWDSINGRGAWDANPWVIAYTFTVARGNIDEVHR